MSSLVFSKNNLFFAFLVIGYLFGVILYDFLEFKYTDELMVLFLLLFASLVVQERRKWKELIPLSIVVGIFAFYTIYSFVIRSNVPKAILKDLIIQIKPFLGFYCAYLIAPQFTNSQKLFLSILCLVIGGGLLVVGLTDNIYTIFGHPSRFATATVATAFLFLYCNSFTWNDIFIFIFLLTIGFFSTRSKFYGFWAIAIFFMIYGKAMGQLRFNKKGLLMILGISILAILLAKDKIILYYVNGMINSQEMWSRPAMMLTSGRIFLDYFPFGSGLGSFGTYASGEYYSSIYEEYGLNHLWGLSKNNPAFICDAFYPELAQFGIVGVLLYIAFWYSVLYRSYRFALPHTQKQWLITLSSFTFFLIEGVADATFTHNRGLFILVIMAIALPNRYENARRSI